MATQINWNEHPKVAEAWEGYVGGQNPQEFMDISRQRLGADCTQWQAVDAYINEQSAMWQQEGMDPSEIEALGGRLVDYLTLTSYAGQWH